MTDLVDMSRRLGDPAMQYAILGEGNTSITTGEHDMLVKASGSRLSSVTDSDFVVVDLAALLSIVDDSQAGEHQVDEYFDAVAAEQGRRPSVEALLHAVCLDLAEVGSGGHTHPVAVNSVLCSSGADLLTAGSLFPDQIVVLGTAPMLVDYIDPGLELARHVRKGLAEHMRRHSEPPKVIYLRNHGMFALGRSTAEVIRITEMAEKSARILLGAASIGTVRFMPPAEVARIDARPDEAYRRRQLEHGAQQGAVSASGG